MACGSVWAATQAKRNSARSTERDRFEWSVRESPLRGGPTRIGPQHTRNRENSALPSTQAKSKRKAAREAASRAGELHHPPKSAPAIAQQRRQMQKKAVVDCHAYTLRDDTCNHVGPTRVSPVSISQTSTSVVNSVPTPNQSAAQTATRGTRVSLRTELRAAG